MNLKGWICVLVLLSSEASSRVAAPVAESSIVGHAKLDSKSGVSCSDARIEDLLVEGAACSEKACQAASIKAAEKLVARTKKAREAHQCRVEPLDRCECSDGSIVQWNGSCDKLKGLARQLCYAEKQ